MGETVDQTLREIEATRSGLERDIDELFGRLPEPAVLARQARTYGAAAAGAAVLVGVVAVRARARSEAKARRMEARINAEELARAFSPHAPPEDEGGSGAGAAALVVAAAALVLSVANAVRSRREA